MATFVPCLTRSGDSTERRAVCATMSLGRPRERAVLERVEGVGPKKPSGDGSACAYLDPMESWRFAQFEVCIETPKDSGEFRRYVGPLRWAEGGEGIEHTTLQTTLYDDDAREYFGDREISVINVSVEVDEDVLYLPPGGGDPLNLGTIESGSFEQYFQKPTVWVSIRGLGLRSNENGLAEGCSA